MTEQELNQLLHWRKKRGYKGLNLRGDKKAWTVNFGPNHARSSKNFPFTASNTNYVLWQLEEACEFLESVNPKSFPDRKMFGEQRQSRIRHLIVDGNDLEGVFLERHSDGLIRLQIQLHLPHRRLKYAVPKKLHDEVSLSWVLAFGRQIRGVSFDHWQDDLTNESVKAAWRDFIEILKYRKELLSEQEI